jgi:deoxyribonuclease V
MSRIAHDWDLTPTEAAALQRGLAPSVDRTDRPATATRYAAGVDIGFERNGTITRAAVAVLDLADLALVDFALAHVPTRFPYVPGLLSFRETPAALEALRRLSVAPDVVLYDGHGIAHPRRFGVASHVGLLLDLPSIGVAKTRLVGAHDGVPESRGAWTALVDAGETIGAVLRTRPGVAPVYVSIGHRVCLASAIATVMRCTTRFRLPETTRWAHRIASDPRGVDAAVRACGSSGRR